MDNGAGSVELGAEGLEEGVPLGQAEVSDCTCTQNRHRHLVVAAREPLLGFGFIEEVELLVRICSLLAPSDLGRLACVSAGFGHKIEWQRSPVSEGTRQCSVVEETARRWVLARSAEDRAWAPTAASWLRRMYEVQLSAEFQYFEGFVVSGDDVGHSGDQPLSMTLRQAMEHSNADPRIKAFTFIENEAGGHPLCADSSIERVWFKSKGQRQVDRSLDDAETWATYVNIEALATERAEKSTEKTAADAGFQYFEGFVVSGDDVGHSGDQPLSMTLRQAMEHSNADPRIKAFTFIENEAGGHPLCADSSIERVWFKSKGQRKVDRSLDDAETWATYVNIEALSATFECHQGCILGGDDVGHSGDQPLSMTLQQAMAHANADPHWATIQGFTFVASEAGGRPFRVDGSIERVWFKSKGRNQADRDTDPRWATYVSQ